MYSKTNHECFAVQSQKLGGYESKKHRFLVKLEVWSQFWYQKLCSVCCDGRKDEEKPKVARHLLIKFRFWKLLPCLTGTFLQQLESWNPNVFVETQEADRCELKTRAGESSSMCAIIITATVQHSDKAQREFYTARLVVGVPACIFFLCRSVMRLYLISVTLPRRLHTPVLKWFGVKGCAPVFSILSSTWQFEIRSGKTISQQGSVKNRINISFRVSEWRIISEYWVIWEAQDHLLPLGLYEKW